MSDEKNKNRKPLTRREFLKVGAGAAAAGIAGSKLSKAVASTGPRTAPAFLQAGPLKVKMLTWFWQEQGRGDAWKAMIKKFEESQKNITIEQGGWPFDQYTNQILVQVKAGKIDGDVFTTTPDLVLRLLRAKQLEPLEDVVQKAGVKNLDKAHDNLRIDGKVHGLDIVTVRFGLLYNAAMFKKAGLEEPKSIDEWVDATKKLTKRPDQFGIYSAHTASNPEEFWFTLQQWAVLYDGVWAKDKTPMVTSDPVIKGLKLFKTMYDAGMPQGTDSATANKMYASSRLAQQLIVSAAVNVWKTEGPDIYKDLKSAAPFWPGKKAITRIHPICVNANASNDQKAAAKEFIGWLYKPENYRELLERCLDVIPAFPDGIRKEYLDSLFWSAGYQSAGAVTPPDIMGEFIFYNQEFGNIVTKRFEQVLTANRPVEEAMAEAQKELEALGKRVFA